MHELISKQDIIGDAMAINKSILLQTNKTRHNWLQAPNQDPSTYFIENDVLINLKYLEANASSLFEIKVINNFFHSSRRPNFDSTTICTTSTTKEVDFWHFNGMQIWDFFLKINIHLQKT